MKPWLAAPEGICLVEKRQRIAIARAMLKNAPIVILDEALPILIRKNEAVIQEAISRLTKGQKH